MTPTFVRRTGLGLLLLALTLFMPFALLAQQADLHVRIEAIDGAFAFDPAAKTSVIPLNHEVTFRIRVANRGDAEATGALVNGGADPAFFEIRTATIDPAVAVCEVNPLGFFICPQMTLPAGDSALVQVTGVGLMLTTAAQKIATGEFSTTTGGPNAGSDDDATTMDIVEASPTVTPAMATVPAGGTQLFSGYLCPLDANGALDLGDDGIPGTPDDDCTPVNADWSTSSGIGSVDPTTGPATVFTATDLSPGETASGAVLARVGTDIVFSNVLVEFPVVSNDILYIEPEDPTVPEGGMQVFSAYLCPIDTDGNPILGPDGKPGTPDDECTPINVDWSVTGNIGTVNPSNGATTTLSATLPDGSTSQTGQILAASDGRTAGADVTVVQGGSIRGKKFARTVGWDEGGYYDELRPRNGVVLELVNRQTGEVLTTTTGGTDADGNDLGIYQFPVTPGEYFVREVEPEGYRQVFPLTPAGEPTVHDVTVAPGEVVDQVDFENLELYTISGRKFLDVNGNGDLDPDEAFVDGWPIELVRFTLDGEGEVIAQTTTTTIDGKPGSYRFENLDPGFYVVREELRPGFFPTVPPIFGAGFVFLGPDLTDANFGNRPTDVIPVTDEGDGEGLREVIEDCNARPPADPPCEILIEEIVLKTSKTTTIRLARPLPPITRPLVLDGGGTTILDGADAGDGAHGLVLAAGGTDVTGLTITGFSGHGLLLDGEGRNRLRGNTITGNGGDGIRVANGADNLFLGNAIFDNGGQAIDLGGDGPTPNDAGESDGVQNYPVITSVATDTSLVVEGMFTSTPDTTFVLDFFANTACAPSGLGQGQTYLGLLPVFTDSLGLAAFTARFDTTFTAPHFITATATNPDGATSEFSPCDASLPTALEDAPEAGAEVPTGFRLFGNYPNPFNPETVIRFEVPEATRVHLQVYDVLGRLVQTLIDEPLSPGTYRAVFEAGDLPSGVYFYRLTAGAFTETRPMVLMK